MGLGGWVESPAVAVTANSVPVPNFGVFNPFLRKTPESDGVTNAAFAGYWPDLSRPGPPGHGDSRSVGSHLGERLSNLVQATLPLSLAVPSEDEQTRTPAGLEIAFM